MHGISQIIHQVPQNIDNPKKSNIKDLSWKSKKRFLVFTCAVCRCSYNFLSEVLGRSNKFYTYIYCKFMIIYHEHTLRPAEMQNTILGEMLRDVIHEFN